MSCAAGATAAAVATYVICGVYMYSLICVDSLCSPVCVTLTGNSLNCFHVILIIAGVVYALNTIAVLEYLRRRRNGIGRPMNTIHLLLLSGLPIITLSIIYIIAVVYYAMNWSFHRSVLWLFSTLLYITVGYIVIGRIIAYTVEQNTEQTN